MDGIEKLIQFFSPNLALKRMRSRVATGILEEQLRKYDGAGTTRRTANWNATGSSANTEIAYGLHVLRNRMRELFRNNRYATKALRGIANNTVGTGIRPSIKAYRSSFSAKKLAATKQIWKDWADSTKCDFDGRTNFYGIQLLAMKTIAMSGEVLIRRRYVKRTDLPPIELQLLEPDFLDTAKDGIQLENGNYIRMGIEFNPDGKRVAYWLFDQHPGENMVWRALNSRRISAEEVIHLYYAERPGQIRGVPFGASAMIGLRDFDEYQDAELIRKKIAACFSVFVTQPEEGRPGLANGDSYPLEKVEPGIIEYLQPGQTVEFGSPPQTVGDSGYTKTVLQGIAAGFGVTYEMLTNDLSNVNFSSGRMGWIDFHKFVTEWQTQMIIPVFCSTVWDWVYTAGQIAGLFSEGLYIEWTAPKREMIDPKKETDGLSAQVRNGFTSRQEVQRRLGFDPEVVNAELAEDAGLADDMELQFDSDPRHDKGKQKQGNDPPKKEDI